MGYPVRDRKELLDLYPVPEPVHLFLCMQIVLIKSYVYYFIYSLGSDSGLTDKTFDVYAASLFFFKN